MVNLLKINIELNIFVTLLYSEFSYKKVENRNIIKLFK